METNEAVASVSEDDDFDAESMAVTPEVLTKDRAERFYDRVRASISRYLDERGGIAGKAGEVLLLVPDFFILLWRLVNDDRVTGKNKVLVGSGLAYYLFPLDMLPDMIPGTGYLDDVILAVYLLNKVLGETDVNVLRDHWSGSEDVLGAIQKVVGAAENLISSDMLGRVKKLVK
jgi:uncharacterized membrane protein YkvA (DUF1232 family)